MAANAVVLHRTTERKHLQLPIRVERLEEDEDKSDARYDVLESKIDKLSSRFLGMVLASTGAAVAFAANLVILLRKG